MRYVHTCTCNMFAKPCIALLCPTIHAILSIVSFFLFVCCLLVVYFCCWFNWPKAYAN